jgi:hypothetical protein
VQDHPDEFAAFVLAHNIDSGGVVSAYPQLTALEVLHVAGMRGNSIDFTRARPGLPGPASATTGAVR